MTAPVTAAVATLAAALSIGASGRLQDSEHWPCTDCHPVGAEPPEPGTPLEHAIELVGHDRLARGAAKPCWSCHVSDEDPGVVWGLGGDKVSLLAAAPRLCEGCHAEKVRDTAWGIHGKGRVCVSCHPAHAPGAITIDLAPWASEKRTYLIGPNKRTSFEALPPLRRELPVVQIPHIRPIAGLGALLSAVLVGLALSALRRRTKESQ